MDLYGIIYKCIDKNTNNCIYIGKTMGSLKEREKNHFSRNNTLFDKHIHNQEDQFIFEIVEYASENTLDEREQYWINYYDTYKNGYNQTLGGDGGRHLSDKTVKSIQEDIINGNLSAKDIIKKYNISESTYWRINTGRFYYNKDLYYPLRNKNYKKITQEQEQGIHIDLKNNILSMKEIAEKYNVSTSIISDINNGKIRSDLHKDEDFPIRTMKGTKLTSENYNYIIKLLENTNKSFKEISEIVGNISISCISDINRGRTYFDETKKYPIRKEGNYYESKSNKS